jgi:hypothetical protein
MGGVIGVKQMPPACKQVIIHTPTPVHVCSFFQNIHGIKMPSWQCASVVHK